MITPALIALMTGVAFAGPLVVLAAHRRDARNRERKADLYRKMGLFEDHHGRVRREIMGWDE